MMKLICPICNKTYDAWGRLVPGSGITCKSCGVPLVPLDRPPDRSTYTPPSGDEMIPCPRCAYRQVPSDYCVNCGLPLSEPAQDESAATAGAGLQALFRSAGKGGTGKNPGLAAAVAVLLVLIMALGSFFFGLINSEPYRVARSFIRENQDIRHRVGEPISFGLLPTGSIKRAAGTGEASFNIKAKGPRGSTKVSISLVRKGEAWRVVTASFDDREGSRRTIFPEKRQKNS